MFFVIGDVNQIPVGVEKKNGPVRFSKFCQGDGIKSGDNFQVGIAVEEPGW